MRPPDLTARCMLSVELVRYGGSSNPITALPGTPGHSLCRLLRRRWDAAAQLYRTTHLRGRCAAPLGHRQRDVDATRVPGRLFRGCPAGRPPGTAAAFEEARLSELHGSCTQREDRSGDAGA